MRCAWVFAERPRLLLLALRQRRELAPGEHPSRSLAHAAAIQFDADVMEGGAAGGVWPPQWFTKMEPQFLI